MDKIIYYNFGNILRDKGYEQISTLFTLGNSHVDHKLIILCDKCYSYSRDGKSKALKNRYHFTRDIEIPPALDTLNGLNFVMQIYDNILGNNVTNNINDFYYGQFYSTNYKLLSVNCTDIEPVLRFDYIYTLLELGKENVKF